ncbi:MAG: hypothetical protein DLM60_18145 [Pseudonocardiales bacterium]|nr:MAG: hypothetical protein DLM60_18145 [Pseudonocardiales bacterium]
MGEAAEIAVIEASSQIDLKRFRAKVSDFLTRSSMRRHLVGRTFSCQGESFRVVAVDGTCGPARSGPVRQLYHPPHVAGVSWSQEQEE